jgi:preprotein translocase subunit SecG
MKKVLAIIISLFFVATLSLSVVGCKKAEEQQPAETAAPAPAPAPEAAPAPAPAPEAPAAPATK